MKNQETEGLLSPWLRDQRLSRVADQIQAQSSILDLACGRGDLHAFLPENCSYYGVDRIPPPDPKVFTAFLGLDLSQSGAMARLAEWLPGGQVDVITMVAFVEHLKDPSSVLSTLTPLLKPQGMIILTTPHPSGRLLHDTLARLGICSRSGADEHERFFGKADLHNMLSKVCFTVEMYDRFLFGLNQIVCARWTACGA